MDKRLLGSYKRFSEAYHDIFLVLREVAEEHADHRNTENINEIADNVYVLTELEKRLDDFRKEVSKLNKRMQKIACYNCIMEDIGYIDTEYCGGKPETKEMANVPSKRRYNPEAFDKVMDFLGVPKECYLGLTEEGETIRPHWPAVQALIAEKEAKGEHVDVPKVDNSTIFLFKITKKKKVL
jgi:hypothetical protein